MKVELIEKAAQIVGDNQLLVNIVSKRVQQLNHGSDPFIAYHGGKYYYPFMFWGVICVSSFNTLDGMTTDGAVNVFPANVPAEASQDIWSPKMYFIDGRWYIYYSASDGNLENHRMYVLRSKTSDAMGEYEFIGKVLSLIKNEKVNHHSCSIDICIYFCKCRRKDKDL